MIKTYANFYKELEWQQELGQFGGGEYTNGEVNGWAFRINRADHMANNDYQRLQTKCYSIHRSDVNSEYSGRHDGPES